MVINKGWFMARNRNNYSGDRDTEENFNVNDKYAVTGESEFSRESTIPFDDDEVLSERHYTFGPLEYHGRKQYRSREPRSEPSFSSGFRGKGPKGYVRSDERIKDDVSNALYRSTVVDATEIEVFVEQGTVTLKGLVNSRDQKRMAEDAVEHLPGVKDVFNEIRVKRPFDSHDKKSPHGLTDNITGLN